MPFKYAIDKKVIFENDNNSKIVIRGCAIDENGNVPSFFMKINGTKCDCATSYEERSDVEEFQNVQINLEERNPSSFGFIVVCNYVGIIEKIELYAVRNDESCILSLQDEELKNTKKDGELIISVDNSKSENELVQVNGWCLSKSNIRISVENDNGNLCESAYHKTNRYDLCDLKFINESEKLCGF